MAALLGAQGYGVSIMTLLACVGLNGPVILENAVIYRALTRLKF